MPIIADNGRGAHPKLRATTHRFWPFDENVQGPASSLIYTANNLDAGLSNPSDPLIVDSPIGGRARRFQRTLAGYPFDNFLVAAGDATSRDVHEGETTIGMWIRLTEVPAAVGWLYLYAGVNGDDTAAQNYMRGFQISTGRQLACFWEYGAGVNVSPGSFSPVLDLHRWYHVVMRWTNATTPGTPPAAGPTGTVDLDMFLNGHLVDGAGAGNVTFQGLANTSDGTSAQYYIGAESSVGGAGQAFLSGDVAGVYVEAAALSAEEIEDDFRRGLLLPFYHRLDVRVLVEAPDGVKVDLTNHLGQDFLTSVDVSDGVDDGSATARIDLVREVEDLSVAVLRTDTPLNLTDKNDPASYDPLLDVTRGVDVLTARVPLGIRAYDSDFAVRFSGNVDEIDWGGDGVTVSARDGGGVLVDQYIEEEVKNSALGGESEEEWPSYGSAAGAAVEGEMQKILDDNDNSTGNNSVTGLTTRTGSYDPITLYTPFTPAWFVLLWRQRREPVLTALRSLSAQIGWDTRYRYDANAAEPTWRLTLYEPDRAAVAPSVLFRAGDVIDSSRASLSAQNIRNVVRIVYLTSEDADTAPTVSASAIETGLLERYKNKGPDGAGGRRPAFYEVEDPASIARWGRKFMEVQEPSASQVDTIDEAQRFAIAALFDLREPDFEHSVDTLPMPEIDVGDIVRFDSNDQLYTGQQQQAVTNLTLSLGERSRSSLQMRGKPTVGFRRWLQLEARPGVGRPPVIDPMDALTDVNIGGLLQVVSGLIEKTDYFSGGKFLNIRNASFTSWTRGIGNPPDSWTDLGTGVWGTDIKLSTDSLSGTYSLEAIDAPFQFASDLFAVNGDVNRPLSFEALTKKTATGGDYLQTQVYWYSAARVLIGSQDLTSLLYAGVPSDTAWHRLRADGIYVPGTTTKYGRLVLKSVPGDGSPFRVDEVSGYIGARTARFIKGAEITTRVANGWYNIRFNAPPLLGSFDYGNQWLDQNNGSHFLCRESGRYEVTLSCMPYSSTQLQSALRIVKGGTYSVTQLSTGGTVDSNGSTTELQAKAGIGYAGIGADYAAIMTLQADVFLVEGDVLAGEVYLPSIGYYGNTTPGVNGQVTYMKVKQIVVD